MLWTSMKHWVFSSIQKKRNCSQKDKLFAKCAQKTIFPPKYRTFVGFGLYILYLYMLGIGMTNVYPVPHS